MQKNLFGNTSELLKKDPVKEKPKSSFPDLSISKGLKRQEATADAIFWHRILINKSIRQQKADQFLKILSNEIAIKKGTKDLCMATLDSLKHGF